MNQNTTKNPPGRAGVPYETVVAAAEAIVAIGGRATLRKIRDSLGTGSLGTIQKHLTKWQESHRPAAVNDVDLSPELRRAILGEMNREVAIARSETNAELADAKGARDELAEEVEHKLSEIEQLTAQVAELENSVATQGGTIDELRAGAATGVERERVLADRTETLARDLARAEVRLEQMPALEKTVADIRVQLDVERKHRNTAELEAAGLAATIATQNKVIDELHAGALAGVERERAITDRASAAVLALEKMVAEVRMQLDAEREQRHTAVREAAVLAAKLAAAESLAEVLANQKPAS